MAKRINASNHAAAIRPDIVYDRIIREAGIRTGRIETVARTLEDGSTATGYRERW